MFDNDSNSQMIYICIIILVILLSNLNKSMSMSSKFTFILVILPAALQPSIKYGPYALPQSPPAPIYGHSMVESPSSLRAVAMDDNSYLQVQSSATSLISEANRGASSDYSYTPKDE